MHGTRLRSLSLVVALLVLPAAHKPAAAMPVAQPVAAGAAPLTSPVFWRRGWWFGCWRCGWGVRFWGGPVVYGAYGLPPGYYGGCEWLHRRAALTGNAYWWHRYRECRDE